MHVRVLTREGQIVRLGNHLGSIAASRDHAPLGIFDGCRGARIMGKRQKRSCVRPDYRIKSQNALGHKAALIGNKGSIHWLATVRLTFCQLTSLL